MKYNLSLCTKADIRKLKELKISYMLSWIFSNALSLIFPIGAIILVELFRNNGDFDIRKSYPEFLMVAISISTNLIMQINSQKYNITEDKHTFIKIVTSAILVFSSLAYGIAKSLENNLELNSVFEFSLIVVISTFAIGFMCELKKK